MENLTTNIDLLNEDSRLFCEMFEIDFTPKQDDAPHWIMCLLEC